MRVFVRNYNKNPDVKVFAISATIIKHPNGDFDGSFILPSLNSFNSWNILLRTIMSEASIRGTCNDYRKGS